MQDRTNYFEPYQEKLPLTYKSWKDDAKENINSVLNAFNKNEGAKT